MPAEVDDQELLMRYLDGELTREEARQLEKRLAASPALSTALEAMTQVREVVVARYGAAVDEAAPGLDRLWSKIEQQLETPAPVVGAWERFVGGVREWFEQYRGHLAVGALSAVAGVVIALSLVKVPESQVVYAPRAVVPVPADFSAPEVGAAVAAAEIESLEVTGGSGTIFQIPADEGDTPTTVIWVTRDEEGPI